MPEDVFGPLLAPWNVEKAILSTLEEWVVSYIAEVERKNELPNKALGRPPVPESYRGGLDWTGIKEDFLPTLIVIANPLGEPERQANLYIQPYEVQIGVWVTTQETANPEAIARRNAGLWGAAVMGAIEHHGKLGVFEPERTVTVAAPRVELHPDMPDNRRVAGSITAFHVFASLIKSDSGPLIVKSSEPENEYPEFPEAKTKGITVKAEPVTEKVH